MNTKKGVGIVAGFCVLVFGGVKLLEFLGDRELIPYSKEWMSSLSDDELEVEREKIRKAWCKGSEEFSPVELESLLFKFDKEMRDRSSNGDTEYGYPKHSEHGWYLSGDD